MNCSYNISTNKHPKKGKLCSYFQSLNLSLQYAVFIIENFN